MYVLRMKVIVRATLLQQCIAALSKLFGPLWASAAYLPLPDIPWAPRECEQIFHGFSQCCPTESKKGNQVSPTASFYTSLFHCDTWRLAEICRKKVEM